MTGFQPCLPQPSLRSHAPIYDLGQLGAAVFGPSGMRIGIGYDMVVNGLLYPVCIRRLSAISTTAQLGMELLLLAHSVQQASRLFPLMTKNRHGWLKKKN